MSNLLNVMDILILAILALSLIAGMYRGFLASGLHTAGFVGAWFVAKATYMKLATEVLANRALMGVLSNYLEAENFFPSTAVANMSVADAVNSGQLATIADAVAEKIPIVRDAFVNNVQSGAFSALNISTLKDYLDQTVWTGAFNVLSFLLIFALSYAVIALVVNLFNHVFSFPALRVFDRLLGGAFGLVRGAVVVVLLITLMPMVLNMVVPDLMAQFQAESQLMALFSGLDFMNVQGWIATLIGG